MSFDEDQEPNHERWLVSYADFITLMFAFFVVLYATSEKDLDKTKEFQDSIRRFLIKAGSFGESGQQIKQGEKNNAVIEPPIQTFRPSKAEVSKVLDQTEAFVEEQFSEAERKTYISDISADEWGVRVTLNGAALYSAGSSKFKPEAVTFMGKLSGLIPKTKRHILVEGHTAAGETGGLASPWDFASARAVNMLRFIQTKQHMKSSTIAAASFGDSRPLFQGTEAASNSRIELVFLHQDLDF